MKMKMKMDEDALTTLLLIGPLTRTAKEKKGFTMQRGIQEWEDSAPVWPNRGTASKYQPLILKDPCENFKLAAHLFYLVR